jgi:transcriptional regulator with XRE-family HTH domain
MEYEIWTRKLRALRLSFDLRQEDVAKKMRISRSQYSAIENGKSVANYKHLYNLAKALGIPLTDLISMNGVRLRGTSNGKASPRKTKKSKTAKKNKKR